MSENFTGWMKFFIDDLPAYIINYFKTFFALLFHPRRTLKNITASDLMRPKEFLFINIILLYFIGKVIGYEFPQFPFKIPKEALQVPFFYGLSTFLLLLLRFTIGILIFSFLLGLFLKIKGIKNFISIYFPIFCYSTVVYIPFILLERTLDKSYSSFNNYMLSNIFSGIQVNFVAIFIVEHLLYWLLLLALLYWWLYLIYIGLKFSINKNKIKRAIAWSYVLFLIIQLSVTSIAFIVLNYSTYEDARLINSIETGKTNLIGNPPNYMNAATVAGKIAHNKNLPTYIRYSYTLREAIYWLAIANQNDKIVSKALKYFRKNNYLNVQNMLTSRSNNCPTRTLFDCSILKEFLKKSNKLKRSTSFIDSNNKFLNITLNVTFFGMGNRQVESEPSYFYNKNLYSKINPKKVNIKINLPVPSLISLFP